MEQLFQNESAVTVVVILGIAYVLFKKQITDKLQSFLKTPSIPTAKPNPDPDYVTDSRGVYQEFIIPIDGNDVRWDGKNIRLSAAGAGRLQSRLCELLHQTKTTEKPESE